MIPSAYLAFAKKDMDQPHPMKRRQNPGKALAIEHWELSTDQTIQCSMMNAKC